MLHEHRSGHNRVPDGTPARGSAAPMPRSKDRGVAWGAGWRSQFAAPIAGTLIASRRTQRDVDDTMAE